MPPNKLALPGLLILFPTLIVCAAMLGLLLGIPVTRWIVPTVLFGLAVFSLLTPAARRPFGAFLGILLALYAANLLNLCDYGCDSHSYHTPAAILLAHGWNPFADPQAAAFLEAHTLDPASLRLFPAVSQPLFIPLLGATLYAATGQLNAAGFFDPYWVVAAFAFIWAILPRFEPRLAGRALPRAAIALLLSCHPIELLVGFSGPADIPRFTFAAIFLASLELFRRTGKKTDFQLALLCAGILLAVKFNALLIIAAAALLYAWPLLKTHRAGLLRTALPLLPILLLLCAYPYLHNALRYRAPLYPIQTNAHTPPAQSLTPDFHVMNADAASMNRLQRLAHAYLSPALLPRLNPRSQVLNAFDGAGPFFRLLLLLSLPLLTAHGTLRLPAAAILLATLAIPTLYAGYARYALEFTLLPTLLALNALTAPQPPWRRCLALAILLLSLAFLLTRLTLIQGGRAIRRQLADTAASLALGDPRTQIDARAAIDPAAYPLRPFPVPRHEWPPEMTLLYAAQLLDSFTPPRPLRAVHSSFPADIDSPAPHSPLVLRWPWEGFAFIPPPPLRRTLRTLADGATPDAPGTLAAFRRLLDPTLLRATLAFAADQRPLQLRRAWTAPILDRPFPSIPPVNHDREMNPD